MYIHHVIVLSVGIFFMVSSCMPDSEMEHLAQNCQLTNPVAPPHPNAEVLQGILDKYTSLGIPGLSSVVGTSNGIVWAGTSGFARIEDGIAMQLCNEIYPASIGKTFCAVATLLLVQDGLIGLDEPISSYLSKPILDGFRNGGNFTVRQLLNHTGGLSNLDWNERFLSDIFNDPYSIRTSDLLKYEKKVGSSSTPGTKFVYSSTGYEILAVLIDEVTGNHAKFYTDRIFSALDLDNTLYKNEASYPYPDNLVNSYFDRFDTEQLENISNVNSHLTSILTGSDGVISTPVDLYEFLRSVITGPLLSDETRKELLDFYPTGKKTFIGYGLGLWQRKTAHGLAVGHDGDAIGAGADMWYFLDHDIYIITATNIGTVLTDTKLAKMYNEKFQQELYNTIFK